MHSRMIHDRRRQVRRGVASSLRKGRPCESEMDKANHDNSKIASPYLRTASNRETRDRWSFKKTSWNGSPELLIALRVFNVAPASCLSLGDKLALCESSVPTQDVPIPVNLMVHPRARSLSMRRPQGRSHDIEYSLLRGTNA